MIFDAIIRWFTNVALWFVNLLPAVNTNELLDIDKSANFFTVIGRVSCLVPLGTVIQIFVVIATIYTIEFLWATGNYAINKIPGINS